MPQQLFIEKWDQIHQLSNELKEILQDRLNTQTIKKGQTLYKQNERLYHIYFIVSGLLVGHRLEQHKSSVCWFLKEHDFLKDHESIFNQKLASHTVIATENTTLLSLSYRDLQMINHKFPEANVIAKYLLNHYLQYHQQRISLLTIDNSTARYYSFVNEFQWAIGRLKRSDIASFLNMSPETLSRIR
nr:Crp/Fnr family transcriptional regulator [uncultured Pedobacter sp.]